VIRVTLSVELDVRDATVHVTDVEIKQWNGHAPYKTRVARCDAEGNEVERTNPWAVLAECSAPSRDEAYAGLRGIVEHEPDLAWTHAWPHVYRLLNPGPFLG
jgi:hypothetical protein